MFQCDRKYKCYTNDVLKELTDLVIQCKLSSDAPLIASVY